MANFTKMAIRQAFLKLLSEKPYSSITVKDIVSECGINRNSFYYHYQDIPALLEEIARERCDAAIHNASCSSIEDCLNAALDFSGEDKRAFHNIYCSVDRAVFERYLWKICEYAVTEYGRLTFPADRLSEQDRRLLTNHTICLCFGLIMGWMENGVKEDFRQDIPRLAQLLQVMTEACLTYAQTN